MRIVKRMHNSVTFETAPGRFETHITARPMFERGRAGLWIPVSQLTSALKLGARLIRSPRAALAWAAMLPFATTDTFQPDAAAGTDTMIVKSSGTLNWGITTWLGAGGYASYTTQFIRGLLQFDVSSIPAINTVDSATLTLYCEAEQSATNYDVSVHRGLTQWYEGEKNGAVPSVGQDGSTWNLRNKNGDVAWAGGAGGAAGSDWANDATATTSITGTGTTFDWNVLADVADWVDGSADNYGWWLHGIYGSNTLKSFTSSDGATAGNRPKLVVVHSAPAGAATRSFAVIVG